MEENGRYSRHYKLAGFGKESQEKLSRSRVLVIGAGGLGCPVLQYLVSSGVGEVGIVDHDTIEIDNLQRQVLYNTEEVGRFKANVAAAKLRLLNPDIQVHEYVIYLSTENAEELINKFDVIVDCTDNFATRYLLADVCRLLDKPLVFGAIFRYEGQVAVFNLAGENGIKTTYRHLFPTPPSPMEAPDCNAVGVLGVLPGTIGTLQAVETIKILTGIGQPLSNKLMTINLLDYTTLILDIPETIEENSRDFPATLQQLEQMDYEVFCGGKPCSAINIMDSRQFIQSAYNDDVLVIDVRHLEEMPRLSLPHIEIPLHQLSKNLWLIDKKNLILVCQSGKRSLAAAEFLRENLDDTYHISHLEGGVMALDNV
ncbi:HesA/MoeB/ThiF family protein [Sphingobacterium sp.]|uniref:HesA/MoeB/ThiF family protein n=1 Tax=Sphingobacterium sp. TaxID=341027 RepID=UPI0028980227|nr:HesA/MoeB/ThiF family protein [Sphingobacterium sp.]